MELHKKAWSESQGLDTLKQRTGQMCLCIEEHMRMEE